MTETMTAERFKQTRGPTIEFTGRQIAFEDFETKGRDPMLIEMEIWETEAGNLVARSTASPLDSDGFTDQRAAVIEKQDDETAMQIAVMDFFAWEHRARKMVQRQLEWDLTVRVA